MEVTQDKNRLYVKWAITPETLKGIFGANADQVTESRIVRGEVNHNFGFVTFASEDAAANALASLEQNPQSLTSEPVYVEYAAAASTRRNRTRAPRVQETSEPQESKRTRRPRKKKDFSGVTTPLLFPDLATVQPQNLTTITAQERKFRSSRKAPKDGQKLESLTLTPADMQASDFQIGGNQLKLVSFQVKSSFEEEGADSRVTAKIYDPVSGRSGDIYLRLRPDNTYNYKFFEIRTPIEGEDTDRPTVDSKFVTIESIELDRENGAWTSVEIGYVTPVEPVAAEE